MDLSVDLRSPEPSYRQLAVRLRAAIEAGELRPGDPLPSLTYLVGETGLATGTVRKAVGVLADDGLVYVVPGRGTFVAERPGV